MIHQKLSGKVFMILPSNAVSSDAFADSVRRRRRRTLGYVPTSCVAAAATWMAGCTPVVSTAYLPHGTQGSTISIDIEEGPGRNVAHATIRVSERGARVRLENNEQLYINDTRFIRSQSYFSEALVATVPVSDEYRLESDVDGHRDAVIIRGIPRGELEDISFNHDGHGWVISGTIVTAPTSGGHISQQISLSQVQGDAGEAWLTSIGAPSEQFQMRLSEAQPRRGGVEDFIAGQAVLRLVYTMRAHHISLQHFNSTRATVRIIREVVVDIPASPAGDQAITQDPEP